MIHWQLKLKLVGLLEFNDIKKKKNYFSQARNKIK